MLAKKHYFIQLRKIYYPIAESIYIPLCFYFIGKKPDYRTTVKTIYIPLCFYFILIRCSQRRQTTLFTFHYASTLSSCRCYKEFWIRIYIPLCFYFIPFIVLDSEKLIFIYIPLCFYFILRFAIVKELMKPFTFHYASTLSGVPTSSLSLSIHIYIPLCFYFIRIGLLSVAVCKLHLHSTMLLLYRWSRRWKRLNLQNLHSTMLLLYHACGLSILVSDLHLHSTMLLLYRDWGWFSVLVYKWFTFHYASTLSILDTIKTRYAVYIYIPLCFYFIKEAGCTAAEISHLHSTMLLLYLLGVHPDILIRSHLHSTMLLLYQPEDKKPLTEERIYIPLCFYFIEYPFFSSQSI